MGLEHRPLRLAGGARSASGQTKLVACLGDRIRSLRIAEVEHAVTTIAPIIRADALVEHERFLVLWHPTVEGDHIAVLASVSDVHFTPEVLASCASGQP